MNRRNSPDNNAVIQAGAEPSHGTAWGSLRRLTQEVSEDGSKGKLRLEVETVWKGGTRTDSQITLFELGGQRLSRPFSIRMDEPPQLSGGNSGPNPLEMFLAAFNACIAGGYAVACSGAGIALESLIIQTEGELDLRGFLGLDAAVRPGYDQISYRVRIRGQGTPEQFRRIHETVLATSPNRWNVANVIQLRAELEVECTGTAAVASKRVCS